MQIGVQTITWGSVVRDWPSVIAAIDDLGFDGVEFAQHPLNMPPAHELSHLLRRHDLRLSGLTGGALQERIDYCGTHLQPRYFCAEIWNEATLQAMNQGVKLALHPHFFMPIRRIENALPYLERYEEIGLILDLTHMYLAGDVLEEIWDRVGKHVLAVHLKDWTPEFGRSSHSYARGVVELGQGEVHPELAVEFLRRVQFNGWLIAEQDWSRREPTVSLEKQAEWMHEQGLLSRPPSPRKRTEPQPVEVTGESCLPTLQELNFLREMFAAGHELLGVCYERVVRACATLFPEAEVTLWSYSAAQDMMMLQASHPDISPGARTKIPSCRKHIGGAALERKTVLKRRIDSVLPGELAGLISSSATQSRVDRTVLISLPVLNPYNLNHVRLVVNIVGGSKILLESGNPAQGKLQLSDADLMRLSTYIAWATNSALDDWCSYASAKGSFAAARSTQTNPLISELVSDVQHVCDCEAVSVFVVNHAGDQLAMRASSGMKWNKKEEFYGRGEGITGTVWQRNEALLVSDFREHKKYEAKSEEQVASPHRREMMYIPMVGSRGDVQGVIRCRNRRHPTSPAASNMFSDDDAAVIEALAHAAVPHLEALRRLERRARALQQQSHEMKNPLTWTRGTLQLIVKHPLIRRSGAKGFFGKDFVDDIDSYCDLALGLLANTESATSNQPMQLKPVRTLLLAEVVAPAARQVGPLCEARGFRGDGISFGNFDRIPLLLVDRSMFQQVFFNLLANAIKYAYQDPSQFDVQIIASAEPGKYSLRVRDYGPGVEEGLREKIFLEGFRALPFGAQQTEGHGWGLWIIRQIVERHGGTIVLSNCRLPTEFTITLPASLASRAPD